MIWLMKAWNVSYVKDWKVLENQINLQWGIKTCPSAIGSLQS